MSDAGIGYCLQCCSPTCGAAAAVVCTPEFAARHDVAMPVRIRAQAMTTDAPGTYDSGTDMMTLVGFDMLHHERGAQLRGARTGR